MSAISTHVLNLQLGRPAVGLRVVLQRLDDGHWKDLAQDQTDQNGRIGDLTGGQTLVASIYRLMFDSGSYFASTQTPTLYPRVDIVFRVSDPDQHHHIPLLLGPYGYTTYRGS